MRLRYRSSYPAVFQSSTLHYLFLRFRSYSVFVHSLVMYHCVETLTCDISPCILVADPPAAMESHSDRTMIIIIVCCVFCVAIVVVIAAVTLRKKKVRYSLDFPTYLPSITTSLHDFTDTQRSDCRRRLH